MGNRKPTGNYISWREQCMEDSYKGAYMTRKQMVSCIGYD
jgi:hypothetical protein